MKLTAYSRCVRLTSCFGSAQLKRTLQAGYISRRVRNGLYKEDILLSVCVRACVCLLGSACMFIMSTLYGSITVNLAICFLKLNCQK